MNLGALDRTVTIQAPGAAVDDGHTLVEGAFATIGGGPLPATYRPTPGTERFASAENAATAPAVFWVRWSADIAGTDPRHQLLDDSGRAHNIVSVTELGRRDGLEILAVRRAEGPAA